ncbi:MAG: TPM domain-containing protein [Pseudomonadota bacterium]
MKPLRALLWLLWLAVALPAPAQQLPAVPPLAAHLTDQAGMLDARQHAALEAVLADYEAKTGSQIAVLLVKSTAPEAIEQYSIRVADAWKVGRKGVDDGVLLLVAKDNPPALRRLRIEAGRGVQGVLTDAQSKRVLQDVIAPHFRQNDFYGGLVAGVGAISALLNQEKFPAADTQAPAEEDGGLALWLPLLFFGGLVLLALLRSRGGPRVARGNWGSGAKGVLLGAVLNELSQSGRHGGGFGGGGGGGGGGFSGGGGGFDGGGASGNW